MIICAAIKVQVTNKFNETKEIIFPCFRHGEGIITLRDWLGIPITNAIQGFIDSEGNFLDRKAALIHAKVRGQLPKSVIWQKEDEHCHELFSEDLY
jgi:hypothetical protein